MALESGDSLKVDSTVTGNVDVNVNGDVSTSADISSSLEDFALYAICFCGAIIGWRRAIPGVLLILVMDFSKHSGQISDMSEFSFKLSFLLVVLGVYYLIRHVVTFIAKKRTRKRNIDAELQE